MHEAVELHVIEGTHPPAERAARPGKPDIVTRTGEFAALRAEWNTLAASSPRASVYQTHEWLFTWWKHFGADARLHILIFRDGGSLAGAAPLLVDRRGRLRLIGGAARLAGGAGECDPSDRLDCLALPGFESAVGGAIARHCDLFFHDILLENVPADGLLVRSVIPRLRVLKPEVRVAATAPFLAMPPDGSYPQLPAEARRRRRQAEEAVRRGIYAVERAPAFEGAFAALVALHQERWRRRGFPGLFADEKAEAFFTEACSLLAAGGRAAVYAARAADGTIIAARLALFHCGTTSDYLSGFDELHPAAHKRPGLALLYRMIDDARGGTTLDLLRGDEGYKRDIASGAASILRVTAWRGSALVHALGEIRERGAARLRRERSLLKVERSVGGAALLRYAARRARAWRSGTHAPAAGGQRSAQEEVNSWFREHAAEWIERPLCSPVDAIYEERHARIMELARSFSPGTHPRVLEVGCGGGAAAVALALEGRRVTAIDAVAEMAAATRLRAQAAGAALDAREGDVHALPFPDSSFDLVVAEGVIPWLHAPERACAEMRRVLAPHGTLIVTCDNSRRFTNLADPLLNPYLAPVRDALRRIAGRRGRPLARMHTRRELARMLAGAGFTPGRPSTLGFAPVTLFRRECLPAGRRWGFHATLQALADRGTPLVRHGGAHIIAVARCAPRRPAGT